MSAVDLTPEDADRLYLLLKGARERLCRATTHPLPGAPHRTAALVRAVDEIDSVGAILPQWSRYDMPDLPPLDGEAP